MKRRRRDEPTPDPVIAAARAAFEAAAPGVGICDRCGQPTGSRAHRKRCEG